MASWVNQLVNKLRRGKSWYAVTTGDVESAIRATIHEAARRVCNCPWRDDRSQDGIHEDHCPAQRVLAMEAGK